MVPEIRQSFNHAFTESLYQELLQDLDAQYPGAIEFRLAETPQFISKDFFIKLKDVADHILSTIQDPAYITLSTKAIPTEDYVQGNESHPHFIALDFGVCQNENGEFEPRLIELQGFPTLFGFQDLLADSMRKHYNIPEHYSHLFSGLDKERYYTLLKEVILGDVEKEHVILLEIHPHQQKTRIDFYCMQTILGIQPVCITELFNEGDDLFYMHQGVKTKIERIYNRIIFDELHAKKDSLGEIIDIRKNWNVKWITHPNWYYRISKFTLPFLHHPYIPEAWFLNEIKQPPTLENYVLKPLYSFAGKGVVIDVKQEDLEQITDPENWILQRKVTYAPIIETPDEPAKLEIRLMYIWKDEEPHPQLVTNLTRLSKGKMIGVDYNKNKTWVGGSIAFFES